MTAKWFIHMWMLGMCSVEDCKEKRISLWKIRLYAVLILAYEIWYRAGQGEGWSKWMLWCLMGILPGTAMLVISRVSKETIGYGDGYLTLILGFSMGFWDTLGILGISGRIRSSKSREIFSGKRNYHNWKMERKCGYLAEYTYS